MLHDNMDISRLIMHAQHVEENRLKMKNREFKRDKSYKGGNSKGRIEMQDCHTQRAYQDASGIVVISEDSYKPLTFVITRDQ